MHAPSLKASLASDVLATNARENIVQTSTGEANCVSPSREQPEPPRNQLEPPREQLELEVEENAGEERINYPTGPKLWLTMASLCIALFLNGLDLTIVAVAVPSLTNQFKTVEDIGWYSAAYGLTLSSFVFFFGKVYTIFAIKPVFIFGLVFFELGSLLCTFAPSSIAFILGRAVAGFGTSVIAGGVFKILSHSFPLSKQALAGGLVGSCQSIGLVTAPVIGGALIDTFGWRACFGINLPLGAICIALTAYGLHDPVVHDPAANSENNLPLSEKIKRINLVGALLIVPAIACFLMALQWGGIKYGWKDVRIIVLFVLFGLLFCTFGYVQYRQGEAATLPIRILKQRSILAGMWYTSCCNGVLAMTEYYISIYLQGVRGFSATRSGLLALPMIAGLAVAILAGGIGTSIIGYYYPFMLATSVLAPIASGLLTTLDLEENIVKVALLLGFLGIAIGLGLQSPQLAVQAVLPTKDVSIGTAIILFGAGMGSSLWICASATLFQNRLAVEVTKSSPGTNITAFEAAGLSDIRGLIGSDRLKSVLLGYDTAVVQTLYMPLALGALTIFGSVAMERRSIKKKKA